MNTSETVAVGHEGFASSNEASLEDLGEIWRDRINNPKYVRKAVFIYGPLVGALGVLSGYALYFKLEPIVHGDEGVLPIVLELVIAAVMVAILEWVTEIIEKGLGHSLPYRRTAITAIFAFVLFELFVLAAHSLAGVQSEEARHALDSVWAGDWRELVGLAAFWVIIGGGLTAAIARAIFGRPTTLALRGTIGASAGAGAGLLILFYMLLVRAFVVAKLIVLEHSKWHVLLSRNHVTASVGWAMDWFLDARPLGPKIPFSYLLLGLVAIAWILWSWLDDNWTPLACALFVVIALLALPVLDVDCIKVPIFVFLMWSVPGALLGAFLPWLQPRFVVPRPRLVAGVLVIGALALIIVAISGRSSRLMCIPAGVLIATSYHVYTGKKVLQYWPLVALSIAILACVVTPFILKGLSFSGGFGGLDGLTAQGRLSEAILGKALVSSQRPGPHEGGSREIVLLQVCIVGAVSFWVSVALLMGWSIQKTQSRTIRISDDKDRCFWVEGGYRSLIDYHDLQHGLLPSTDEELFKRLCLELLSPGYPWFSDGYLRAFMDFDPALVSKMNVKEIDRKLRQDSHYISKIRIQLIIRNAKRLIEFNRQGQDRSLIRSLQLKGKDGPQAVILFFRKAFDLRAGFAAGSFLQSTGFLPDAHFRGCWRHPDGQAEGLHAHE
jgi:3-methyladenine DNA glycosylase Tag